MEEKSDGDKKNSPLFHSSEKHLQVWLQTKWNGVLVWAQETWTESSQQSFRGEVDVV